MRCCCCCRCYAQPALLSEPRQVSIAAAAVVDDFVVAVVAVPARIRPLALNPRQKVLTSVTPFLY